MKKNTLIKGIVIATLWCLVLAIASIADIKLNNSKLELFWAITLVFLPIATFAAIKMWNYIK